MLRRKAISHRRRGRGAKGGSVLAALLAASLLCTACAGTAAATVMRLMRTEGTVGVSDSEGKELSPQEDMRLYSGYRMETERKSYAWINLDSVKLTKMDAESEIEIQKDEGRLEIIVNRGELFFHISEPLSEEETLDIRTSTMAVGIRGTCGWVRVMEEGRMYIGILEGSVQCSVTDPESGESMAEEVSGGEQAELLLLPEGQEDRGCEIVKEEFAVYYIPAFVMTELMKEEELREKVQEDSGLDIPSGATPQGYIDMGRQYLEHGRYEDAADILTEAIGRAPEQGEAYVLRGNAYVRSGDGEEYLAAAQDDYEAALDLDETAAQAYLGLADIQIRRGEYDQARDTLKQGLEKTGGDEEIADKLAEIEGGSITDSSNRTRLERHYDGNGLVWQQEYIYDGHNVVRTVAYDAAGAEKGAVDVLYDEEGRCIQTWGTEGNEGTLLRMAHRYDESGNQVESDCYYLDGTLHTHYTHEFDGNGNLVRSDFYDGAGNSLGYQTLEYDEYGMVVRESNYNAEGTLENMYVSEYDERHNVIKSIGYDGDGNIFWETNTVNEYDDEGRLIRTTIYDGDGNLLSYTEY